MSNTPEPKEQSPNADAYLNVTQQVGIASGGEVIGIRIDHADIRLNAEQAAASVLKDVEPPYGIIWRQMKAGKVVPFLGAGASFIGRAANAVWQPKQPSLFPPSGPELAGFLADEAEYPSTERADLAKISSYYAELSGRPVLRKQLREMLNYPFTPGRLHHALAAVPAAQVIVTTNYDTLLEQAFRAVGRPYDLIVYMSESKGKGKDPSKEFGNAVFWLPYGADTPQAVAPNALDIDLDKVTVIFKMHGSLDTQAEARDQFVITEEDYVEFLSRMTLQSAIPAQFMSHFRERSFLFLGYGLGDWNLRVILKNLSKVFAKRRGDEDDEDESPPSWAIQSKPTEVERTLWERRNVHIFDSTGEAFAAKLQERMK